MIKIINCNAQSAADYLKRPFADDNSVAETVQEILTEIRKGGDAAINNLLIDIEKVDLKGSFCVAQSEFDEAEKAISEELKCAMECAKTNIELFHTAQKHSEVRVEVSNGVECVQRAKPITRVGLYIPGGSAPLFSTVLMLALPAKIAGCREIVLATPPTKEGRVASEILYAAQLCGVTKVYKLGGAIAIGAMAYGSETIKPCFKIFGPGNRYVTTAKQIVSTSTTAIDMPAGPSEVMVVCDDSAVAEFVAADLLSQAEHGPDSQAICVTTSVEMAERVKVATTNMVKELERATFAQLSLANSAILVVDSRDEMLEIVNEYAPEHLIVSVVDSEAFSLEVDNAGSIFIGNYTPESAGDYCSGTNHTLPTSGWAKSYSGVNLDSFTKKITYQRITREGINSIAPTIIAMANAEGLTAHALAAKIRTQ
ncbi:MAG: histidinol dehydrogenase [Rikenellaceae bacterium]